MLPLQVSLLALLPGVPARRFPLRRWLRAYLHFALDHKVTNTTSDNIGVVSSHEDAHQVGCYTYYEQDNHDHDALLQDQPDDTNDHDALVRGHFDSNNSHDPWPP